MPDDRAVFGDAGVYAAIVSFLAGLEVDVHLPVELLGLRGPAVLLWRWTSSRDCAKAYLPDHVLWARQQYGRPEHVTSFRAWTDEVRTN